MSQTLRLFAPLLPVLTGLAGSAALLVDYVRPIPVFCDAAAGCGVVRETVFAYPLGIPLPAIGVVGFMILGALVIAPGKLSRTLLLSVAAVGACAAAFLFYAQHTIGSYCPYCVLVDASAILALPLAALRLLDGWNERARTHTAAGVAALALAVGVPLALGAVKKPGVPAVIRDEIARTPAGQVAVIDFVDFECPWCRLTHETVGPLIAAHRSRIHLVRKNVPLTHLHPHALEAARAACCGDAQGKGDDMADALFSVPEEELTREGCERIAARLGLDLEQYRACLLDPKTEARIEADRETFKASNGRGLPTIWIGKERIDGAQRPEVFQHAMDAALAGS